MAKRLNQREVLMVKSLFVDTTLTDTEIATRFGVDRSTIGKIRNGRTHKDIKYPGFVPSMRNRARANLNDHLEEIIKLKDEDGWSFQSIGNKFKYSASSIQKYYQKGIENGLGQT